ncbi:hypothetical protein T01_13462 [Trichinella spiralis]|uniref:Uncharacterized protein n=1 Tax=Trichinella spiralis TaxID=6334 RepID=A0A0V1BDQ3_TRISP|nr:hypothetical protein T01_13462 [Trichinella spiralis]
MTCFPRAEIIFRSWSSADQGIFFAFFDSSIITTSAWLNLRTLEACLIAVMHQQACCQIRHRERFTSLQLVSGSKIALPLVVLKIVKPEYVGGVYQKFSKKEFQLHHVRVFSSLPNDCCFKLKFIMFNRC